MLRAKSFENKIVDALEEVRKINGNTWMIVETYGRIKEKTKEQPFDANFLLLLIGNVFPSVYMMTDVVIPAQAACAPSTIRLQEAYIGLPDYTRNFFSQDNLLELHVKVELNKSKLVLHMNKDGTNNFDIDGVPTELCDAVTKVCMIVKEWFNLLNGMGSQQIDEMPEDVKENDVIFVLGRNRKVYKLANGELGFIHQGKKMSLIEAKKLSSQQKLSS